MNPRAALAVVGVLAVLIGCGSRGEPPPPEDTTSAGPEFADLLPPRPRDLDLTGVDPCADLLTDQQLRELAYDLGYARPPLPGRNPVHDGPDCTFASNGGSGGTNRNVSTLVSIATNEDAAVWVTDPERRPRTRPDVVDIHGFWALVLPHPVLPDDCTVVVDTGKNQYLEVATGSGDGTGTSQQPYCAEARRVADMALRTISSGG